jgi:hypothetical protein
MAEAENPFQAAQTIDPEVRAYVYSLVTAVSPSQNPHSYNSLTYSSLAEPARTMTADIRSVTMP